jgi:hypothetical protein
MSLKLRLRVAGGQATELLDPLLGRSEGFLGSCACLNVAVNPRAFGGGADCLDVRLDLSGLDRGGGFLCAAAATCCTH